MTAQSLTASESLRGWKARLELGYEKRGNVTVLARNSHVGPLRVQSPLYPEEEVCHTCILHPPGGVVAGDRLEVDLEAGTDAHALITTPGATKFYRSGGAAASQHQRLTVHGGVLEWFPQDNIVFPGAVAEINTHVHLDTSARFIGWEVLCLGLPTRKEPFHDGSLVSRFSVYREKKPVFLERLDVTGPEDLIGPAGLRGQPVMATFIASGADESILHDIRDLQRSDRSSLLGFTLIDDLLVGRYLGDSTFEARELFQKAWSRVRPRLIGRAACPPRIWST